MAFFLAIDVGGTKTDYLLADDTRELAAFVGEQVISLCAADIKG